MSSRRKPNSRKRFSMRDRVQSITGTIGTVQWPAKGPDGRVLYRVKWDSGFESRVVPGTLELFEPEDRP